MQDKIIVRRNKIEADANGNLPKTLDALHEGSWYTPWHGDFEITRADIHEFIAHFNDGVGLPEDNDGEAQVNYGHESHREAGGWMSNPRAEEDSEGRLHLMFDLAYTPDGEQAIRDKKWKYVSSEFNPRSLPWVDPENRAHTEVNVITGAAFTNIPLIKKLKKLMASERIDGSNKPKEGEPMTFKLEEVRVLEASALSDEQKAFLETHKKDLTSDELEKFGIKADEKAPKTKVEANAETVTISASELADLKANAQQGVQAAQKLAQKEASDFADARIAAGQVKSGEKDKLTEILLASSDDARTKLEDFLKGLPVNADINHENGENKPVDKSASDELADKAQAIVTASQGKTRYTDAIKEVLASDKELRTRVETERNEQ